MKNHCIALFLCGGIGCITKRKLWEFVQGHSWEALLLELTKADKVAMLQQLRKITDWQATTAYSEWLVGNPFITIEDPEYPPLLKEIADPPLVLFYAGHLELLQQQALAVVGSRAAATSRRQLVGELITPLLKDYVIISGLARGIDSFAHQLTTSQHGQTIGIVGCGLDRCYPSENQRLFQQMKEEQLIISEYPKGTPPRQYHFPQRNRLIAGLAQGVVVIEAKEKSGSLITAQLALENGREVFAVPGDPLQNNAEGCHSLIRDGAKCTTKMTHILEELS